ncbi:hypothetical protein EK21DRAFT_94561 [Setomelanomma holmii]|uniref:Uncharacterized protein n=1 Tax=Setomelanomma holmii TaxID=210430 RepID=A0A9P4GZ91_9PLEO|nr:hypothetical protein EK21DRAFT_94561 [Setomelanomma holmii]
MQPTLALISALALLTTSVAAVDNALSFTTWPCTDCGVTEGSACQGTDVQNVPSGTCFSLTTPNPLSIVVDFAKESCFLELYGAPDCQGNGPTFGYDSNRPCKPIPVNERTSYQVICP